MPDHVHLLVSLGRQTSVAEAMRMVKANSSHWLHENFPALAGFDWQAGCGAFSVSAPKVGQVEAYLARQAEHHRTRTFQMEFVALLERHGVAHDERYLWD